MATAHYGFSKERKSLICFVFSIVAIFAIPFYLRADTIYTSPPSGEYSVSSTFPVRILVSSQSRSVNAVSGTLNFPIDRLQVVSINKENSIVNLWIQEPSFSNDSGTISFEGVMLNPGFIGQDGLVITATFRVIGQGPATLSFNNTSLLANDGAGTNVLRNIGKSELVLGSKVLIPTTTPPTDIVTSVIKPLDIRSSTHPDENGWYTSTKALFEWDLDSSTREVRLLFGKNPSGTPSVSYVPPVDSKEIDVLNEGTWYFFAQQRTASGWSPVSRYKFNVDNTPPISFSLQEYPRYGGELLKSVAVVSADAVDELSGIFKYEFSIDGGKTYESWNKIKPGVYESKVVRPGEYVIIANAYDQAGQSISASTKVTVPGINPPEILDYSRSVTIGDLVTIEGVGMSATKVRVYNESGFVLSEGVVDVHSNFVTSFDSDVLGRGVHVLTLDLIALDGSVVSIMSRPINVEVSNTWFESRSESTKLVIATVIPVISMLVLIVLMLSFALSRITRMKRIIRKEVDEARKVTDQSFDVLREDIYEYVRILEEANDRRRLTKEERLLIEKMRRHVDGAERMIEKEVDDIKEKIK